jgi:hypothetical protein
LYKQKQKTRPDPTYQLVPSDESQSSGWVKRKEIKLPPISSFKAIYSFFCMNYSFQYKNQQNLVEFSALKRSFGFCGTKILKCKKEEKFLSAEK